MTVHTHMHMDWHEALNVDIDTDNILFPMHHLLTRPRKWGDNRGDPIWAIKKEKNRGNK